jgi:hypothetical protein
MSGWATLSNLRLHFLDLEYSRRALSELSRCRIDVSQTFPAPNQSGEARVASRPRHAAASTASRVFPPRKVYHRATRRPINFPLSCLAALLVVVVVAVLSPDNHVGTRLMGSATLLGAMAWGLVLGGVVVRVDANVGRLVLGGMVAKGDRAGPQVRARGLRLPACE